MSTRRAAVIGHPVSHSLSPAIHNAMFAAEGRDCVYEAIETDARSLPLVVQRAIDEEFIGLSVTMPLKELVIEHLHTVSNDASILRAVNCVVVRDGETHGHNTDGVGCVAALRSAMNIETMNGVTVALLGAGGTARAVALELARDGAGVTVVNRSPGKASSLVEMVNSVIGDGRAHVGRADDVAQSDVIINATSVGMGADAQGRTVGVHVPCDVSVISSRHVVLDAVYQPLMTAFLSAAESAGAIVVDGLWMLVWQAVKQQRLWFPDSSTDFSAMATLMRAAAEQELSRRRQ